MSLTIRDIMSNIQAKMNMVVETRAINYHTPNQRASSAELRTLA